MRIDIKTPPDVFVSMVGGRLCDSKFGGCEPPGNHVTKRANQETAFQAEMRAFVKHQSERFLGWLFSAFVFLTKVYIHDHWQYSLKYLIRIF